MVAGIAIDVIHNTKNKKSPNPLRNSGRASNKMRSAAVAEWVRRFFELQCCQMNLKASPQLNDELRVRPGWIVCAEEFGLSLKALKDCGPVRVSVQKRMHQQAK